MSTKQSRVVDSLLQVPRWSAMSQFSLWEIRLIWPDIVKIFRLNEFSALNEKRSRSKKTKKKIFIYILSRRSLLVSLLLSWIGCFLLNFWHNPEKASQSGSLSKRLCFYQLFRLPFYLCFLISIFALPHWLQVLGWIFVLLFFSFCVSSFPNHIFHFFYLPHIRCCWSSELLTSSSEWLS